MPDRENREKLLALLQEHPYLPVIFMVGSEVVAGDDCAYWLGSWGHTEITKYLVGDEKVHFYDEDDQEEICQTLNDRPYSPDYEDAYERADDQNLADYKALPWVEAIVVYIDLP